MVAENLLHIYYFVNMVSVLLILISGGLHRCIFDQNLLVKLSLSWLLQVGSYYDTEETVRCTSKVVKLNQIVEVVGSNTDEVKFWWIDYEISMCCFWKLALWILLICITNQANVCRYNIGIISNRAKLNHWWLIVQ